MPCTAGRMISRITREWTFGVTTGAGEYAPMPPVLGPASPSRRRLWSCLVAGGRDALAEHERLGEILRRLERRGGSRRAENPESRRAKRVDHAGGERRFRTDDGQLDIFLPCEGNQVRKRAQGDVLQPGLESRAGA